jgi:hypothetical protein
MKAIDHVGTEINQSSVWAHADGAVTVPGEKLPHINVRLLDHSIIFIVIDAVGKRMVCCLCW